MIPICNDCESGVFWVLQSLYRTFKIHKKYITNGSNDTKYDSTSKDSNMIALKALILKST